MTGTSTACAASISAGRSEIVPRYPGSVRRTAMGFSLSARLSSLTPIPIGTPVAPSISGDIQMGSSPASTSALNTERCAVRETATLSPGFPRAKMIAWFA